MMMMMMMMAIMKMMMKMKFLSFNCALWIFVFVHTSSCNALNYWRLDYSMNDELFSVQLNDTTILSNATLIENGDTFVSLGSLTTTFSYLGIDQQDDVIILENGDEINLTQIKSFSSELHRGVDESYLPFDIWWGPNNSFVCAHVERSTNQAFVCEGGVSFADTQVNDDENIFSYSMTIEDNSDCVTSALTLAVINALMLADVYSVTNDISNSNILRREQARIAVVFEWLFIGIAMWFLAMIAAVWMSWICPVFRRNVIWKWSVIFFISINVITWSIGFIGWIAVGGFLLALSVVVNLIYCCKSSRQATFSSDLVYESLQWNRYPRKMTQHQKKVYYKALILFTLMLLGFTIVFIAWKVQDYKIYSRISHESMVEYQPKTIAKASAAIYSFDGFASRLHLAIIFKWSHLCATKFNVPLISDEEKTESIKHNFIDKYDINMNEYQRSNYLNYTTVNDWFSRSILPSARPIAKLNDSMVIVSPADARVIVIEKLPADSKLWLKNDELTVKELLSIQVPIAEYEALSGGSAIIVRLAPQDYHRFHSPISGIIITQVEVEGDLFSVSADAMRSGNSAIYNKRTVTIVKRFDDTFVGFVAIGATCVGSVVSTAVVGTTVMKGDEMGYFQFGGSTVVVLFERNAMLFSDDLLRNSMRSVETLVRMGMQIGEFNA